MIDRKKIIMLFFLLLSVNAQKSLNAMDQENKVAGKKPLTPGVNGEASNDLSSLAKEKWAQALSATDPEKKKNLFSEAATLYIAHQAPDQAASAYLNAVRFSKDDTEKTQWALKAAELSVDNPFRRGEAYMILGGIGQAVAEKKKYVNLALEAYKLTGHLHTILSAYSALSWLEPENFEARKEIFLQEAALYTAHQEIAKAAASYLSAARFAETTMEKEKWALKAAELYAQIGDQENAEKARQWAKNPF